MSRRGNDSPKVLAYPPHENDFPLTSMVIRDSNNSTPPGASPEDALLTRAHVQPCLKQRSGTVESGYLEESYSAGRPSVSLFRHREVGTICLMIQELCSK